MFRFKTTRRFNDRTDRFFLGLACSLGASFAAGLTLMSVLVHL